MTNGLSDRAQTVLVLIAYVLGSVGSATTAIQLVQHESIIGGIALLVIGAIAGGLKEALGALGFKPASSVTASSTPTS